jgi:aldose 1-epimerase
MTRTHSADRRPSLTLAHDGLTRRRFLGLTAGGAAVAALGGLRVPLVHAAGTDKEPGVRRDVFGTMPDGAEVHVYTLTNGRGLSARIMTLGATLMTLDAPDRQGKAGPITLHLDTLADYLKGHPLFGSIAGRYANRIAGAAFTIDGTEHKLEANMGKHQIHGGNKAAFHQVVWTAEPVRADGSVGVRLRHISPDGAAGYPGELRTAVTYALSTADDKLTLAYEATTDKPTHLNLTNHAYWNLAGAGSGDVLGHTLKINAKRYLISDPATKIPSGEIRDVAGTPLDFTEVQTVGSRIKQVEGQNYDHCYVIERPAAAGTAAEELVQAAVAADPASGRTMEVWTTQPGVQLYTAKGISSKTRGGGKPYGPYHGLCLETQHYPDSPHQPAFPSTLLRPGETFRHTTEHRFGVRPA